MGLISECGAVMDFLRSFFTDCLPFAIQILIYGAFGMVVIVSVMKNFVR